MKSNRNKTINLSDEDYSLYHKEIMCVTENVSIKEITNKIICGNILDVLEFLPEKFVDLLIIDPPYNLTKNFDTIKFTKMSDSEYESLFELWILKAKKLLKETGTLYVCCDWQCSPLIYNILNKHFYVRNRITWEREKGRGAKSNYKNCSEDIYFATCTNNYYFDAIKTKRRVLAPYKHDGQPKDWEETENGNFRITYPSNLWTDLTVPFWSMPENTEHPTQKPEKLLAKLILASSQKNDFVFDLFTGSGTTPVVAKKLGRKFCGIEISDKYCTIAAKRIDLAETNYRIQGYDSNSNVFLERNTNAK